MSNSYSSIFNEIFKNDNINTDFIHFFDSQNNTISNDFMPVEVVVNAENVAELQAFNTINTNKISELETKVQALETYIMDLKNFMTTFKSAVYVQDITTGQEYNYDGLL